jgi:TonB-dependent starch-binding outer membrane protein SusC
MEHKVGRQSVRSGLIQVIRAAAMSLLLAMLLSATAWAQTVAVSGTVTTAGGGPLQGVTVRVQGTEIRSLTNQNGKYTISAPANGTLVFTRVGQKPGQTAINGRTTVDVTMEAVAYLEEVVVTAYTEQRRADITGAVSSINTETAARQTSASVLQKLDVVPGVTVAAAGSPGGRSTVRIRGVSSFQNNDPLYIVDGTPVQDSYINWLNPNDITSIQVLKDASAASIYGSRASNGVIVIETTKRGNAGPPKMTLTARTGISHATRGYDDFLIQNSLDYFKIVKASYENANQSIPTNIYGDPNNPTVPAYTYCAPGTCTTDQWGRPANVDVTKYSFPNSLIQPGSAGTNWWSTVFGQGTVGDYNLNISGSGEDNAYGVSFNYFDQDGIAAYNRFRRGSVRANTQFNRGKLSFGENVTVAGERSFGGIPDDNGGEGGILGKNILSQPVVAVYDVAGNFASGKGVGLGNNTNPLKSAYEARNNLNKQNRVFGNAFAGLAITPTLAFRTSLGFNGQQGSFVGYNAITPENSEPGFTNSINENQNNSTNWTLSNTLKYNKNFSQHGFNFLVGQEANKNDNRSINGGISGLLSTNTDARYIADALGDASSKTVGSSGGKSALLSYFGKADYNFADKYVASATIRRDGSSRLAPDNRWGNFPAFGLGWRISKEKFLEDNKMLTDAMLRYGFGVTGNQSIPSGRISAGYGGSVGDTYYDITGSNSKVQAGFRQTSIGNDKLKWEENRATNIGADLTFGQNFLNVVVDVYQRNTNNLLFNPPLPSTAGIASAPIVNIGAMKNTGIDFSVGHTAANWNVSINGQHYKNQIVRIDGVQDFFQTSANCGRYGCATINKLGEAIGSFYGFKSLGFFKDAADVAASPKQDGAAPGRIKFADINGDGKITSSDDRTIIGSPHPNLTGGLDLGYRYGNFDLAGTVFGSFGNKIFDRQMEFYVFRNFSTNVRTDLLTDSWTPSNLNAKYPRLDNSDNYSHAISDFYVKDGTYVRMRNIQLGYNLPQSMARWTSAARVYLQAENLFTITGYDGLDPALPAINTNGAAGDIRDQFRGIDQGSYPSSRTFSIGVTTSF